MMSCWVRKGPFKYMLGGLSKLGGEPTTSISSAFQVFGISVFQSGIRHCNASSVNVHTVKFSPQKYLNSQQLLHQLPSFQIRRRISSSSSNYFSKTTTTKMSENNGSACRQNYSESSEALVNKQINLELYASYVYLSIAYYFDRDDVALEGFHKFFKKNSAEENEHAQKLMKYQNSRGGRLVLQSIAKPTTDEWTSPLHAMSAALELEKTVNQSLLDLHATAGRNGDPHLCDFLETEFLDEQVKAINELAKFVTQLKRVGSGLGEHIFDKELNE